VEAAEIIFGEIVSNAMIHAPGPIAVTVEWLAGHAILNVFDAGLPLDASIVSEVADPYDEHGRGLAIVQGLAEGVAVDNAYSQGKTVSAILPVHLG
jgi:signal transduction histidine kinase